MAGRATDLVASRPRSDYDCVSYLGFLTRSSVSQPWFLGLALRPQANRLQPFRQDTFVYRRPDLVA